MKIHKNIFAALSAAAMLLSVNTLDAGALSSVFDGGTDQGLSGNYNFNTKLYDSVISARGEYDKTLHPAVIDEVERDKYGTIVEAEGWEDAYRHIYGLDDAKYMIPCNARNSAVWIDYEEKGELWKRDYDHRSGFYFTEVKSGYYCITESKSGKVVSVSGTDLSEKANLCLESYEGSDGQLWRLEEKQDQKDTYFIHTKLDDTYVMDNFMATDKDGSVITVDLKNGGTNQQFYLVSDQIPGVRPDEKFMIMPAYAGGKVIDKGAGSDVMQLYTGHRGANQEWIIHHTVDGYVYIEDASTGKVITDTSGSASAGDVLRTRDYNNSDSQLWELEPAGDGTYFIRSKINRLISFDMNSWGTGNGTKLELHGYHRSTNKRFRFLSSENIPDMDEWGASRSDCNMQNPDEWDGSSDNSWYYSNRNADVYYIDTAEKLAGLAQLVRDNVTNFDYKLIVLTRDISLGGIEWRRIGNENNAFRGSFNGAGHAITGLSISTTDSQDGFFGEICNAVVTDFAISGAVSGDFNTGGVVGRVTNGEIVDVYSEVSVARATDDNEGGITGRINGASLVLNCTQNARVNSGDKDPDRGGIVGYCCGVVRYCVNKSTVDCNWNYVGGIAGEVVGGDAKIEYCANYGMVCGGGDTERAGGITGQTSEGGLVFGCYNEGRVYSTDDDYIGGIVGNNDGRTGCCINVGEVSGDDHIGGIAGDNDVDNCLNLGYVHGDSDVGSLSGDTSQRLDWTRGLNNTAGRLNGTKGDNGAEWTSAEAVLDGTVCYDLNQRGSGIQMSSYYGSGNGYSKTIFFQNLGGDAIPQFTGSEVIKDGSAYKNEVSRVRAEYDHGFGSVLGTGEYSNGAAVTLTAQPKDGFVFDHFEITTPKVVSKKLDSIGFIGQQYPGYETKTYTDKEIKLTDSITSSYTVKAVFKVFDDVPEDLRQYVKIELECVNDVGGWNSDIIPAYLVDSFGKEYLWDIPRKSLDDEGEKVEKTFDLGAATPVVLKVYPRFGGGITFRGYGLKAKIWINNDSTSMSSDETTIRSWPFVSSDAGSDYMHITFEDFGKSSVGTYNADGELKVSGTYEKCADAWAAAKAIGKNAVIRLDSPWIATGRMITDTSMSGVTVDLNGYPIIRSIKEAKYIVRQTQTDGELFTVESNAVLNIKDSDPTKKSCSAFKGGSIQGARSDNSAGLIQVNSSGTLNMKGGTLYDGGTNSEGGGAIQNKGGTINLDGVTISHCWADGAWFHDTNGGAIYQEGGIAVLKNTNIISCRGYDHAGAIMLKDALFTLENCNITGCKANDNEGGAIYMDKGQIIWLGGSLKNCSADSDNGGGVYQKQGELHCENVLFERNYSDKSGGAIFKENHDPVRLIGCTMIYNTADDNGGAICSKSYHLYLDNTTVTNNASVDEAGGIFVGSGGNIDLSGRVVIRDNDGEDSHDNLYLERSFHQALLYDQGLTPGSDIYVASSKKGNVEISGRNNISQHKFDTYFHPDGNVKLKLDDVSKRSSRLVASVITNGQLALIFGTIMAMILLVAAVIFVNSKKKGEK